MVNTFVKQLHQQHALQKQLQQVQQQQNNVKIELFQVVFV